MKCSRMKSPCPQSKDCSDCLCLFCFLHCFLTYPFKFAVLIPKSAAPQARDSIITEIREKEEHEPQASPGPERGVVEEGQSESVPGAGEQGISFIQGSSAQAVQGEGPEPSALPEHAIEGGYLDPRPAVSTEQGVIPLQQETEEQAGPAFVEGNLEPQRVVQERNAGEAPFEGQASAVPEEQRWKGQAQRVVQGGSLEPQTAVQGDGAAATPEDQVKRSLIGPAIGVGMETEEGAAVQGAEFPVGSASGGVVGQRGTGFSVNGVVQEEAPFNRNVQSEGVESNTGYGISAEQQGGNYPFRSYKDDTVPRDSEPHFASASVMLRPHAVQYGAAGSSYVTYPFPFSPQTQVFVCLSPRPSSCSVHLYMCSSLRLSFSLVSFLAFFFLLHFLRVLCVSCLYVCTCESYSVLACMRQRARTTLPACLIVFVLGLLVCFH